MDAEWISTTQSEGMLSQPHMPQWWLAVLTLGIAALLGSLLRPGPDRTPRSPAVRLRRERRSIRHLVLPEGAVRLRARRTEAQQLWDRALAGQLGLGRVELQRWWEQEAQMLYRAFVGQPDHLWDQSEIDSTCTAECTPLLVFVNSRSGGHQGVDVLRDMRGVLHGIQVVDLQEEGPEAALRWWSKTEQRYRVLVCGGDGTVGWVLGVLEQLELEYVPPVAILPLGTGNDLARVMGWGGGFVGGSVVPVLRKVSEAHVALLDRWTVDCRDVLPAARPAWLPTGGRDRKHLTLCNYFGIGVDAAVALDFHQMRERRPHLFASRLINKLWYLRSGTLMFFRKRSSNLASKVALECDHKVVEIPPDLEGIIVLNISSFGGGSDLWGSANENDEGEDSSSEDDTTSPWSRPSMQDQKLEVVGVHGSMELGAAQVGLYSARRLAQATHVKIINKVALPMQVDGEPWFSAKNGEVEISWKGQALMLARRKVSAAAVATGVIEWALQQKILDVAQRNKLMKEIARRVDRVQSLPEFG